MQFDTFIDYETLEDFVDRFVSSHGKIARLEIIAESIEGRPIRAVHLTNPDVPDKDKEVALIIFGRHGNEIGTRVVAPALFEWLASDAAREILDRQHIIVVPVANSDGCAHEVFGLPVYHLSGLEKRSLLPLAANYPPDVVLDIHSLGKETGMGLNWGGLEAIVIDHMADAGEDQVILREMAREMIQSAAAEGYPFLLHTLEPYQHSRKRADALTDYAFNNHVNAALYDTYHALTFGVEVNHFALNSYETAESGLSIIKSVLKMGNRIFPWEFHAGYPNRIISGDFLASIRPRGKDAGERRRSHKEIWEKRRFFKMPFDPYREVHDKHSVRATVKYAGESEIAGGITVSLRIRGMPKIKSVAVDGERIDYYKKEDACSTHLFVELETIKTDDTREIVVEF